MKRSEIKEEYKWDLSLVLKDDKSFFDNLKSLKQDLETLAKYEGKLKDKKTIIDFFVKEKEFSKKFSRCYLYAFLKVSGDTTISENLKMQEMAVGFATIVNTRLAFVQPELSTISDSDLDNFILDKDLQDYSRLFESIKKNKPHTLSKPEEKLLAGMESFSDFENTFSMLDNVEVKMKSVKLPDGKLEKLDNATYGVLIRNDNKDVRYKTHVNMHKAYSNYNLTISANYINLIKKSNFVAKAYNFENEFSKVLFNEEVDTLVYGKLIKSVHKALPLFYKFCEVKRKALGLDVFNIADCYAPMAKAVSLSLKFDEAYNLVLNALSVFGDDYISVLKRAKSERWIDIYPNDGKQSGAFSVSCETENPFVLLNYNKTYNDISTIAHELGHAMHSYYSEKYQPHEKCDYKIFVAEVASTVNEVLLAEHVLSKSTDLDLQKYIIGSLLDNFYATVFRQTMFSEFEYNMHAKASKDEAITFETLNSSYHKLQKLYFGKNVKLHKYAKYEWSRVSHFYRPFYVYSYATGYISAIAIVNNIKKNGQTAVENYKEFLKSGAKTDPVSLLKIAGIDISDEKTFESAFYYYDELINKFSSMI